MISYISGSGNIWRNNWHSTLWRFKIKPTKKFFLVDATAKNFLSHLTNLYRSCATLKARKLLKPTIGKLAAPRTCAMIPPTLPYTIYTDPILLSYLISQVNKLLVAAGKNFKLTSSCHIFWSWSFVTRGSFIRGCPSSGSLIIDDVFICDSLLLASKS